VRCWSFWSITTHSPRGGGLRSRRLGWRHCGFSAHNEVRVPAEDAEGRKKLAGTVLRAPMSFEKMTYDAATGTVI